MQLTEDNVVDRTIVYRGQTFDVHQTLRSSAELNYIFAGYQYDVLSGSMGHLGFSAGGAYIGTTGTIASIESGTTATEPKQ